jgi:hypothetical protein
MTSDEGKINDPLVERMLRSITWKQSPIASQPGDMLTE